MFDAGISVVGEIVADGQLHRAHVDGDRPGTRNAWYLLHDGDFPAGAFGCHKLGISRKWRADQKREPLTQQARAQMDADRKARAEAQERAYIAAVSRAEQILEAAIRDASQHPYCLRKGIRLFGVKANKHGLLVIPIYSAVTGKLQTIQMIANDGSKKMLTGGRFTNGCFPFSDVPNFWANAVHRIGIGEGWATCATLTETLHETAMFSAFSAGNLMNVARALRARYSDTSIVIYGDHDINGTGQRYANAAATAIDGLVAIPPIPGHDWNDARRAA